MVRSGHNYITSHPLVKKESAFNLYGLLLGVIKYLYAENL